MLENIYDIKKIIKKYGFSYSTWHTILCRPEFNRHRLYGEKFKFEDTTEFNKKILINISGVKHKPRYMFAPKT